MAYGRDSAGWKIHFLCELYANERTVSNSPLPSNQDIDSLTEATSLLPAPDIITTVFGLKIMVIGG